MNALDPAVIFAPHMRYRSDDVPRTPTNPERLRAFRNLIEPVCANAFAWPHLPARPRIPASALPADVGAGQLDHHMPAKAGEGIDPFDKYARTPIPIYRDGREYERDAMQDERR